MYPRIQLDVVEDGGPESRGEGWTLQAGYANSPVGRLLIAEGPRGICRLSFIGPRQEKRGWSSLQADWPAARLIRDDERAERWTRRIFREENAAEGGAEPIRILVRGTPFQVRVWRELLKIGPGRFTSYGRIAAALGSPGAARAVGGAVGRNPVAVLIPCHRVIRETGDPGGYRWGIDRKMALLRRESLFRDPVPADGPPA